MVEKIVTTGTHLGTLESGVNYPNDMPVEVRFVNGFGTFVYTYKEYILLSKEEKK